MVYYISEIEEALDLKYGSHKIIISDIDSFSDTIVNNLELFERSSELHAAFEKGIPNNELCIL